MTTRFLAVCGLASALLFGTAQTASAEIVTITNANYAAGPPRANPQGTWNKAANSVDDFKVEVDYGTITMGNFTADNTIGMGFTVNLPAAPATGNWGPIGVENLKNPLPANTNVRAQMYKRPPMGAKWIPVGSPAYYPIP
jgi:hypothetical protein